MEAKDWPDWVLSFMDAGFFPLDPVKQQEQHEKFREWKESSGRWFSDHGIEDSIIDRHAEFRRRAAVHQKLHPEDRGPEPVRWWAACRRSVALP